MTAGFIGARFRLGSLGRNTMRFDAPAVRKALDRAELTYLRRAGLTVRLTARRSIKKRGLARPEPKKLTPKGRVSKAWLKWRKEVKSLPASAPGSPPHTHTEAGGIRYTGQPTRGLRDAIFAELDLAGGRSVVVGPVRGPGGKIGRLHEFGGTRRGRSYPARPFMGPAEKKTRPKLPEMWRDAFL